MLFADHNRVARDQSNEPAATEDSDITEEKLRELWLILTSWYLIFESARAREGSDVRYSTPQALRKPFHKAIRTFY
jgi:hypothetical protein